MEWGAETVDFGKTLKQLRTQSKLTQQQLAERIGVTKSVISFYEQQERSPSPEVLIKLAAIFHVSTDYLLGVEKGKTIDVSGISQEDVAILTALVNSLKEKNAD